MGTIETKVIAGQVCRVATVVYYRCRCGMAGARELGVAGRPRCSDCGRTMYHESNRITSWVVVQPPVLYAADLARIRLGQKLQGGKQRQLDTYLAAGGSLVDLLNGSGER